MSLFAFGCSTVRSAANYPQPQPQLPLIPAAPVVHQGELLLTGLAALAIIIFFILVFKDNKAKSKKRKKRK